jgi:hypothetical protein
MENRNWFLHQAADKIIERGGLVRVDDEGHSLPFIIFSLYLKSFYFTAAIHCAVYQFPSA